MIPIPLLVFHLIQAFGAAKISVNLLAYSLGTVQLFIQPRESEELRKKMKNKISRHVLCVMLATRNSRRGELKSKQAKSRVKILLPKTNYLVRATCSPQKVPLRFPFPCRTLSSPPAKKNVT